MSGLNGDNKFDLSRRELSLNIEATTLSRNTLYLRMEFFILVGLAFFIEGSHVTQKILE